MTITPLALTIHVDPEIVAGLTPNETAALLNREWEACRDAYLNSLTKHHAANRLRYAEATTTRE